MTYVTSDIHGCYEQYIALLKKINFKDSDTLYVLGDCVGYGPKPMEVLKDMSMRANVIPIVGNHEYSAINILGRLGAELTEDNLEQFADILAEVANWQKFGGEPVLRGYGKLTPDEREHILEYLAEFSLYEIIEVNSQKYILTHAGPPKGATLDNLHTYDLYDFVMAETDYSKVYFPDAILITGHTPTLHQGEAWRGKVYRKHNHLCIDTGGVFGETFACLCLDTGEKFYV
jgi:serine/threonine protein phosphatase 1